MCSRMAVVPCEVQDNCTAADGSGCAVFCAQAMAAAEKLDAVSVHVSGISKLLRQHRPQQDNSGPAPHPPGSAADGGQDHAAGAAAAADVDDRSSSGVEEIAGVEEEPDGAAEDVMLVDSLE